MPAIATGLASLFGGFAAAAPEVAAAAAPEVLAATAPEALALPEILVGPEAAAAAAPAAAAGISGADVAAGLGAGSLLGITPALAGGLSPSSVVGGEFAALPGGGAGPAVPIGAVPGFGPGGAPLPRAAPKVAAGAPGGGGGAASTDLSGSPATTDQAAKDAADVAMIQGANPALPGETTAATGAGSGGGAGSFFSKNAGLLTLLGAGFGGEVLAPTIANKLGLTNVPQQGNLTNIANQAGGVANQQVTTGQTLEAPLTTGVLPPDQQAQIDQGLQSAIGAIKGKYASLGLSGSTMEQSAINDATQNAQVIKGQIEQQMFTSGTQAIIAALQNMDLQEQVYQTLLNAQVAQDNQLQASIGQFASALALGSAISSSKTG